MSMHTGYDAKIQVDDIHLIIFGGLDVRPGGLDQGGIAHLRLVNIPKGEAYYQPLSSEACHGLIGQLQYCIDLAEGRVSDAEDAEE